MDPLSISPQMTIARILEQWPETATVFLKYRLSCLGCSLNAFSTLEEGLRAHSLLAEPFLVDLRQAVEVSGSRRKRRV